MKTSDFMKGRKAAQDEIKSGDIYDVPAALASYKTDPPDNEFIWGHFSALVNHIDGTPLDEEQNK